MITVYDSVTANDIPTDTPVVAGYDEGDYTWKDSDWNRFPNARHIHIVIHATTNKGDILDCENGDAEPQECPSWITMRRNAGHRNPGIYCNDSTYWIVRQAFIDQHISMPPFWLAAWTNVRPTVFHPGVIGVQYVSPPNSGGHYDISVFDETYWISAEPEISLRSTGSAVMELQSQLNARGNFGLQIDGIFGPVTLRDVRIWQQTHGLIVDGIVGPNTWRTLGH